MNISFYNQLPKTATLEDKVFAVIQDMSSKMVQSIVAESKNYSIKYFDGEIKQVKINFIHEILGV